MHYHNMLYLAFIFHMHQPYYKNLLTKESEVPWVRLHGTKDYLDMVEVLEKYPSIHQTFNLVPSLIEQVEDYVNGTVKDRFLELSFKPASQLSSEEKQFLLAHFFSIYKDKVIAVHPRYYDLYLKHQAKKEFLEQDYLDLQVWFNLAWIDPSYRQSMAQLRALVSKARFFTEEDKQAVLRCQAQILKEILPGYRKYMASGQAEVILSPFYHPILPLLCNTRTAKEANVKAVLPKINFSYPQDAKSQVDSAVGLYKEKFGVPPAGMWPSEESVSEHILPFVLQAGIRWIVADEGLLFKSLKKKKRDTGLLYQPHLLKRKDGDLNIVFRDRNLSDMIGFEYYKWKTEDAVNDFMKHLANIEKAFKGKDPLVTIAMDGENAWEYYSNDGHDFLELLYQEMSKADFLKAVTVSEYLAKFPGRRQIKHLAAGSWINGDFSKWIGNPYKVRAWEYLALARQELETWSAKDQSTDAPAKELAWKQMYILEGSDWYWWAGEDYPGYFDRLFRTHLANFYRIIGKEVPAYLNKPLEPA